MTTASPRRPISSTPKSPPRRRPDWRFPRLSIPRPNLPRPSWHLPAVPRPKLPGVEFPRVRVPSLRRQGHQDGAEPSAPKGATPKSSAPEVHPKIAGRRDEVAEAGRRRRRRVRWVSMGVAGTLTGVVALFFSPVFDLDHVAVEGIGGTPATEVSSAAALDDGTAMFGIRAVEVRDRIEELPWVAHAGVDVVWPDRVEVQVTPHRPVAVLAAPDSEPTVMTTSSGRVLGFDEAGPLLPFTGGLPVLRLGANPTELQGSEELRGVLAVLAGLRPVTAAAVSEATMRDGQLVLIAGPGPIEGAELVVGALDQGPEKSQALEATLSGAVELACLGGVDVSVPSRVTIERLPGCTMPTP